MATQDGDGGRFFDEKEKSNEVRDEKSTEKSPNGNGEPDEWKEGSLHVQHGRVHFTNEKMADMEDEDPFLAVFEAIDYCQESALPLLFGVVLALVLVNTDATWYTYYFEGTKGCGSDYASHGCDNSTDDASSYSSYSSYGDSSYSSSYSSSYGDRKLSGSYYGSSYGDGCDDSTSYGGDDHRRLSGGGDPNDPDCQRWLLWECAIFDHDLNLHFVANDILMVFHFGLAMKQVTEALLPGGSLNPPSKAINPLVTTIGGSLGPILIYFILLNVFMRVGMFDAELSEGLGYEELKMGWGAVTATDVLLSWPAGRMVFGDGHPAIDYLLLMSVASDAVGMAVIVIFYPDPNSDSGIEWIWLLLIFAGMFCAFLLRKWHFRKPRLTHQNWVPYVVLGGCLAWVGFIKAHLHPSLALVPIVPFMPGPNREVLEDLEEEVEHEFEEEAVDGHADEAKQHARATITRMPSFDGSSEVQEIHVPEIGDILEEHGEHARGRALTIQAGLYSGLLGHGVDKALKVQEYDDEGQLVYHSSTLDEFEQFMKFPVDFGLCFFALANAGVELDGTIGAMATLIIMSLVIGKPMGVVAMYKLTKWFGYPAPFGVRGRHVRMVGLISAMSLTVSLFVADIAFTDASLKSDCKLGAMISAFVAVPVFIMERSGCDPFRDEDVVAEAKKQVEEEFAAAVGRFQQHHDTPCVIVKSPGQLSRGESFKDGEAAQPDGMFGAMAKGHYRRRSSDMEAGGDGEIELGSQVAGNDGVKRSVGATASL